MKKKTIAPEIGSIIQFWDPQEQEQWNKCRFWHTDGVATWDSAHDSSPMGVGASVVGVPICCCPSVPLGA